MGRSPATFQKRQREVAKRERQQLKAERRAQRKNEAATGVKTDDDDILIMEQPDSSDSEDSASPAPTA
jgi:hypothetical protein